MITDWIMVGITAVYVIATIIISYANIKSEKATREQLHVSKQQFQEMKRLDVMPYLSVEFREREEENCGCMRYQNQLLCFIPQSKDSSHKTDDTYYLLYLSNAGRGVARNIQVVLKNVIQIWHQEAVCLGAVMAGQTSEVYCEFTGVLDDKSNGEISAELVFEYCDLLGNKYQQTTSLSFVEKSNSVQLFKYSTSDCSLI